MLEEFKAVLGKRGFSTPALYRVEFIHIPNSINEIRGVSEMLRDLSLFAESAEVPGTQILTQEHRFYDLPQKYAYAKAHDDLNITFRMDGDHQVRRIFDLWINSIYDPNTGNIRYKADYTGTIHIHQIRLDGTKAYSVEIQDCFPVTVGQISLGWEQAGSTTKLPVTFSFRRMITIPSEDAKVQISEPKSRVQSVPSSSGALQQYQVNNQTGLSNLLTNNQPYGGN